MTKWKTAEILSERRDQVEKKTAGWTPDQLRGQLAEILAAIEPIRYTLVSLVDNPYNEGQAVTSGLWPEQFSENAGCLPEPWGAVFNREKKEFENIAFKWDEPMPEQLELREARFPKNVTVHADTPILSVHQYATACYIFGGSFDRTDIEALNAACTLPEPPK